MSFDNEITIFLCECQHQHARCVLSLRAQVAACICMWALCLPICCVVTGEEIIRSSTGTNNHRL